MLKFIRDFFLKPLKLHFINILLIIITVYLSSLSNHRYIIFYMIGLRLIALIIDRYSETNRKDA